MEKYRELVRRLRGIESRSKGALLKEAAQAIECLVKELKYTGRNVRGGEKRENLCQLRKRRKRSVQGLYRGQPAQPLAAAE